MATFQARIEDLIGTVDNSDLIKSSLTDTAAELINYFPADWLWQVSQTSDEQTSNGYGVNTSKIVSVVRENGTNGEFVECRLVPRALESKIVNTRSLFYPSTVEPVYLLKDGGVHVHPAPGSDPNTFKVTYVDYPTVVGSDDTIPASGDSIKFPNDIIYIVIIGAARKCLIGLMAKVKDSVASVAPSTTFVPPLIPTTPDSPSGSTVILPATPPTYTMPAVDAAGSDAELTAAMSDLSSDSTLGNQTDFTDFRKWFTSLGSMIEDHEDVEIAQAQVQKIQAFISAYSNAMQNRLNKFNQENTEYQAKVQKGMEQARHDDVKYGNKLARYQADIAKYSAQVNEQVSSVSSAIQKFGQDLQRYTSEYQWYLDQYAKLDADFQRGVQMITQGLTAK